MYICTYIYTYIHNIYTHNVCICIYIHNLHTCTCIYIYTKRLPNTSPTGVREHILMREHIYIERLPNTLNVSLPPECFTSHELIAATRCHRTHSIENTFRTHSIENTQATNFLPVSWT